MGVGKYSWAERKYVKRTITNYKVSIVDFKTGEVLESYEQAYKVTKGEAMKHFLKNNGYAAVEVVIEKIKEKRRLDYDTFMELSEIVDEF